MRRGRHFVFGVELPAQVVLTGSEETIAAVLIHEFGHCFYFSTEVIDHIDAGRGRQLPPSRGTGNIYGDEAADRAHLVDPHKWFSPDVAQAFPYWNDPRIQICLDPLWVDHLPVEDGAHHFEANGISIPDDVVEHVRKLRPNRP
jgi:hypothetical protein